MNPKNRRNLLIGAVAVAGLALAGLSFLGIDTNLVYYWSPTELRDAGEKAKGASIRLGGFVEAGTIVRDEGSSSLSFDISDGTTRIPVEVHSVPPAMFREKIGVIVEGTVEPDGRFVGNRLLVKHDNEYRAPEDEKQAKVEDLIKTMKVDEAKN